MRKRGQLKQEIRIPDSRRRSKIVGEIRVHSGKRNYSNFVSTTWLTFNDNCPVKMAVFVAAVYG